MKFYLEIVEEYHPDRPFRKRMEGIEYWCHYWNFKLLKIDQIWLCNELNDKERVLVWDGDWM